QRKIPRLSRLLARFPSDTRNLRLGLTKRGPIFETRAVLVLPSATLVATAAADTFHESLDVVADKMAREIRRHTDTLTRESVNRRRRARRDDWLRVDDHLREYHRGDFREEFFEIIRPVLRNLQQHAGRELVLAQLSGDLPSGFTTVSELVNEVIVSAWERFDQRPDDLPLESWLVNLLHEALETMSEAEECVPLEEPVGTDDPRFEIEPGWRAENEPFWEEARPLTYQDVLSGDDISEDVVEHSAIDQEKGVFRLLRDIEKLRRRTFTLRILEGWGEEEIAMLQGRATGEVRHDVEEVRAVLRDRINSKMTS
ncbi:MAG: integrase, partial [Acidobacteriota bacterium]